MSLFPQFRDNMSTSFQTLTQVNVFAPTNTSGHLLTVFFSFFCLLATNTYIAELANLLMARKPNLPYTGLETAVSQGAMAWAA